MGSIFDNPINTSQGSDSGSIFSKPITTSNFNQQQPTPTSAPIRIVPNATNISQKPNLLDSAINAVKKIGKDITLSFTPPKISPRLPDSAFQQLKPIGPPKPISITPNQKKIDLNQLKTATGNFVNKAVNKIGNAEQSIFGIKLGSLKSNINDIGAILSGNTMKSDYEAYNKLDPWSKLNEATKIFGMLPTLSGISGEIKGAKDVASFVRGLIGGYGVGSVLNYAAQEPKKRSIGEAVKPNLDNMLFAYFTGSTGLPNPFEFLKKQPEISKASYIEARDFLKEMGVKEDVFSNPKALKKAYFDLAFKYHPDRRAYGGIGDNATMAKINKAFKTVKDTFYDVKKTGDKPNIAGLLGDGEHTPQEIIGTVLKNNLEKTPEGKAVIKAAVEAQGKGQNIMINKSNIVYSGQPVGNIPKTSATFYTTDEALAKKYSELNKTVTGTSEVIKKDISGLNFKEVTQKEMLDAVDNNNIKANYDGIKFIDENTKSTSYVVFNKVEEKLVEEGVGKGISYSPSEADKSLLISDEIKQLESQDNAHTKEVRAKIQELQNNLDEITQENASKQSILERFNGKQIQAMRTLKRSMLSRQEKGMDSLISVENTKSYKNNINGIMEALGTNSEREALQFIKDELPDAIVKADTKEALAKIKVLKTHITPKEIGVPKEQIPVGEGKLKVSRLEARMKGVIGNATQDQIDNLGLSTYQTMNKADQIAKASQYVVNNQQEALNVLRGKVEPPKGIIPESIYIAMTELAKDDITLATKLSSLSATALGQRISILSEINKDNPVRLLNEVYKVRAEAVKKRFGENATKKVVKAIKEKVKAPDKYDWNNFINSIDTC